MKLASILFLLWLVNSCINSFITKSLSKLYLGGLMRMPIWPVENACRRSRKAGKGGNKGPDTRVFRETLALKCLSL